MYPMPFLVPVGWLGTTCGDFLHFDRSPILCLKGNKQKQQTSEISALATEIYDYIFIMYLYVCIYNYNIYIYIWLVVSTPLKNISQLGLFFPVIHGK
jgi:hypothetical protein